MNTNTLIARLCDQARKFSEAGNYDACMGIWVALRTPKASWKNDRSFRQECAVHPFMLEDWIKRGLLPESWRNV